MSYSQLNSVAGIAVVAGSVLFLAAMATSVVLGEPFVRGVEISRWLAVPAHVLLLLGLAAIYLVQAERVGVLGLIGFLLAFSGTAVFLGYVIGGWEAAIPEPRLGPIAGVLWLVGLLVLAVATWRAGILPAWTGPVWCAGALLYVSGVPSGPDQAPKSIALVGALGIAVGIGWAGVALLSLRSAGTGT